MAGREKNCKWYFADQPNGQEVGPNNAMEQSFKSHPYASLVRESIQNSLDAVLDKSEPVVVKFTFMEMQGVDYPEFFELQHHIQGCLDWSRKQICVHKEIRDARTLHSQERREDCCGNGRYE